MNLTSIFLLTAGLAFSQTLTLTNPTYIRHVTRNSHKRVEANLNLTYTSSTSSTATPVAALQFTLTPAVPAQFTGITESLSATLTKLRKGITCDTPAPAVTCLIYGLNATAIASGDVVDLSAIFLNGAPLRQTRFVLSGVVAADQAGNAIQVIAVQ